MGQSVRVITGTDTLNGSEKQIVFNSATPITFNLGPAFGDGREFKLKNIGAGLVTILPYGSEIIFANEEESSKLLYTGESATIIDYEVEKWAYTSLDNLGTSAGAKTIPLAAASFLGRQSNVLSVADPSGDVTLAGGYFKASNSTVDQPHLQIVGLLTRASMGKNCIDAYGLQSHLTLVAGAESSGNMTAISGKVILGGNNAGGIPSAGLFTVEGDFAPNNAYGVWVDIVDATVAAMLELHCNGGTAGVGIKIDKSGDGAITKDIKLQNGETIDNAVDGVINFSSAMKLTPQADPPSSAVEGQIYADTDHHLYYYNGSEWKQLDNA